jgi:serine/threonine protein kinase
VKGGDFDKILRKYGALDERIAKFYIGELLLAIEALHKK